MSAASNQISALVGSNSGNRNFPGSCKFTLPVDIIGAKPVFAEFPARESMIVAVENEPVSVVKVVTTVETCSLSVVVLF